jgi:hypothetical protein
MIELDKKDFDVIFDVLNVYDPNDISHVYPKMGESEFLTQLGETWKKVLNIISEPNDTISQNFTIDKKG